MATHLLDDVQQVCDHVVMIDAGTLVVAGETGALLHGTGTVRADVGDAGRALAAELERRGFTATVRDDGWVEVTGDGAANGVDPRDAVRDVAADLELGLHALGTGRSTLDEVFLDRAGSGGTPVIGSG